MSHTLPTEEPQSYTTTSASADVVAEGCRKLREFCNGSIHDPV